MPPAYTTSQKALIAQFVAVTGTDRTQAAKLLKAHGWRIDTATNGWFNNTIANPAHTTALETLFDSYRELGTNPANMDMTATQQYFKDIGVDLSDVTSFIASHVVQCLTVGEVTKDGFVTGWSELKCDTIAKQKAQIATFKGMIGDPDRTDLLDKVYKHAFKLVLQNPGQRILDKDTCMDMWRLFFQPPSLDWSTPRTPWLDIWLKFVQERSSAKGINSDLWNQVLKFAKHSIADDSLGFWNEEQSWPALIDEFVTYVNETRGSGKVGESEVMEFA